MGRASSRVWRVVVAVLALAVPVLVVGAAAQTLQRPSPRRAVLGEVSKIETEAGVIRRRTRSPAIRESLDAILISTASIREVLGPDPAPPPTGGGGTPPPAGPWVDPADTGAAYEDATALVSPWGVQFEEIGLEAEGWDLSTPGPGNAAVQTHYQGTSGVVSWRHVRIHSAPNKVAGATLDPSPDGVPTGAVAYSLRWGARAFDVQDWVFERCTFDTIPDEHGFYGNLVGGITFRRCEFENIGSQAVQLVGAEPNTVRAHETGLSTADWYATVQANRWDWVVVEECSFVEVGQPSGGRPSYAVSAFEGLPNPVRVARSTFIAKDHPWTDPNGYTRTGYGQVMAHNRLRFELLECYVENEVPDRDPIQVWYCGDGNPETVDVLIRGSTIKAGKEVDIRIREGDLVVIEGNVDSTISYVVSTNPPYVWGNNGWNESLVVKRGKLSEDWRK